MVTTSSRPLLASCPSPGPSPSHPSLAQTKESKESGRKTCNLDLQCRIGFLPAPICLACQQPRSCPDARNQGPKTSSLSSLSACQLPVCALPTRRRPACRHHILRRELDDVMPLHQVVRHLSGALVKASRPLTREVERVHKQRRRSSLEPLQFLPFALHGT